VELNYDTHNKELLAIFEAFNLKLLKFGDTT